MLHKTLFTSKLGRLNEKTLLLLSFILVAKNNLFSQDNKCNCPDYLNIIVEKTEENYAGYLSKVNTNTSLSYQTLIKNLHQRASKEQNPKTCFYLLIEYVRFFKDKHFILSYTNEKDCDSEKVKSFEDYFKNGISKKQPAAIEGIWINADTSLKLAIQKFSNNVYKGIVLESKDSKVSAGLAYLTLTTTKNGFIAKEFNSFITTDIPARQKGNLLQIWNHSLFGKIYPTSLTSNEQQELSTWNHNNNELSFQQLTSKTAYFKIPSFFNNDDKIQQLINKNDSIIKACDNLIVDLTGNGGGNTRWVAFLPNFMTNLIVQANTYVCTTPENVKLKLADIEPFAIIQFRGGIKNISPTQQFWYIKKHTRNFRKQIFPFIQFQV